MFADERRKMLFMWETVLLFLVMLLAIFGFLVLISGILETIFNRNIRLADSVKLRVIVAVKDAEEFVEGSARCIMGKFRDGLVLPDGVVYFYDAGSHDKTSDILGRIKNTVPFIEVVDPRDIDNTLHFLN